MGRQRGEETGSQGVSEEDRIVSHIKHLKGVLTEAGGQMKKKVIHNAIK